ncbi:MAG TPA: rhomboid family intramembrane serine protease [Candidatus Bathyarchaeia archaeon]|nr:rhomboid family intramembrane serine protease [Candidatus Bathyarchaeia archaeon]
MLRVIGRPPPLTIILIVINSAIFAYGMISGMQEKIISQYGFIPNNLFQYGNHELPDSLLRLFTSMFIHANIVHISFNLFALAYMGGFAERSMGISRFITIYVASGICGGLLHGLVASYILFNGNDILIGASGAISGILGVAAALGDIRGYYWLAIQVFYVFIGSLTSLSIAFVAHVGGFITGLFVTKIMIRLEQEKRKWY